MSIEAAIVHLLKESIDVDGQIDGRIAPVILPERLARPNVVYQTLGTRRVYSNDGPTGLARATVQLTCYADAYDAAKDLAGAVRAVLEGYTGVTPAAFGKTIDIQSSFVDDERDAPQPPPPGRASGVVGKLLIFVIAYCE